MDPLNELIDKIAQRKVNVVVGAGVSIKATNGAQAASWKGLLETGVVRCAAVMEARLVKGWKEFQLSRINSAQSDVDYLMVAEDITRYLRDYQGGAEYWQWLRDTAGALKAVDARVLKALCNLEARLWTTNYDGLLEEVCQLPATTWRDRTTALLVGRGDRPGVLHLHGFWDIPESVVLGVSSYDQIVADINTQALLKSAVLERTLLFVGFGAGLGDPNFGALRRWMRQVMGDAPVRHFRLVLDQQVQQMFEEHKDDHIYPIPYGGSYDELAGFLEQFALHEAGTSDVQSSVCLAVPSAGERRGRQVVLTHLPLTPGNFFDRNDELAALDAAWDSGLNVQTIVAWGGLGKSALINRWLAQMAAHDYGGADLVFGWTFFNPETGEPATSADEFIDTAYRLVGDDDRRPLKPDDRGRTWRDCSGGAVRSSSSIAWSASKTPPAPT